MHPFDLAEKLFEQLRGLTTESAHDLLSSGYFADMVEAAGQGTLPPRVEFRQFLSISNLPPKYELGVGIFHLPGIIIPGKEKTFVGRIVDGGYRWKDGGITEMRFPLTLPAGPRDLALAHFSKVMIGKQVEAWATENGYEVALIDDLFAVGSHSEYRELQRQFPIIALGSPDFDDDPYVPFLRGDDGGRGLRTCPHGAQFGSPCRFLLRKVQFLAA